MGQCNKVEKGRQLCPNNEIEIPVSSVLESGLSVTSSSNQIGARMLNIYSEPSQSLTKIQRSKSTEQHPLWLRARPDALISAQDFV